MLPKFLTKYLLYLGRWQLSTPVIMLVLFFLGNNVLGVVAANLAGGLLFFWVDKRLLEEKNEKLAKKYLLYLGRWQLTTITLFPVVQVFGSSLPGVLLANLAGGLLFFWVDRWIFTGKTIPPLWEVRENVVCVDCLKTVPRGYRLVLALQYDRRKDPNPEFRCETCSIKKTGQLRKRGIKV